HSCFAFREHHAGGQALCLLRFLLDRISPLCYFFDEELNERSVNCEGRRTHDAAHEAPTSWSGLPPRPRHLTAYAHGRDGTLLSVRDGIKQLVMGLFQAAQDAGEIRTDTPVEELVSLYMGMLRESKSIQVSHLVTVLLDGIASPAQRDQH